METKRDPGFPDTPGLASAVDLMSRAYDKANERQKKADARRRLNSAAPELLAALEGLATAADSFAEHGKQRHYDALTISLAEARAAIAKAKGAGQ